MVGLGIPSKWASFLKMMELPGYLVSFSVSMTVRESLSVYCVISFRALRCFRDKMFTSA
jgi:hypothetical protein